MGHPADGGGSTTLENNLKFSCSGEHKHDLGSSTSTPGYTIRNYHILVPGDNSKWLKTTQMSSAWRRDK